MALPVVITESAERDLRRNHAWWADNRSAEQARRWLIGIDAEIRSLGRSPDRFGFADEPTLRRLEVRQMPYGLGSRPSHRVLYRVDEAEVVVLRVRGAAQDAVEPDDLAG